ncbi:polyketide cyclase / dehydrase and lipid transport [Aldersonia sp. NBC_00410]|uniref:polyketide cyclase / dehydrase and lipid transport n=1 Tax=Aldersonia sp. NBC_00410 TaxID=2975954 RepID=UPI0022533EAA|nr:polyketide cyclase / dehydrase and lipid transport [Aldersonia sp. NBC_00410]MCX5045951.1 polyketide cyclase / dehydrase and lipid transport [Aldersonia sp. NBC_00410]
MSSIQVADQTFVAGAPERVAEAIASPSKWRAWWPGLRLEVREDRAEKGIRWSVAGTLTGTMEVWLEPSLDGVILHYFLHADPSPDRQVRDLAAANREWRVAGKRMSFEVKGRIEAGRAAGEPAA